MLGHTFVLLITFSFQIETIELPIDPKSKKRRGFIFITYKDEASVKQCLEKKYHTIQGGRVCIHTNVNPLPKKKELVLPVSS